MSLQPTDLVVKKSSIPNAGKGLFTKQTIEKGTDILEYTGKVTSWNDANHKGGKNLYIFYVNKNHVVDASVKGNNLARYVNDAQGLSKIKGILNNCIYEIKNNKVILVSTKRIKAGEELFVEYGKDYWKVIKEHIKSGTI